MKLIIVSNMSEFESDVLEGEFPCFMEGNQMAIPYSLLDHFNMMIKGTKVCYSIMDTNKSGMELAAEEMALDYEGNGYTQQDFNGCVLVDNGVPDDLAELILPHLPVQ